MWDKAILLIEYLKDKSGKDHETPILHQANGGSVSLRMQTDHEQPMLHLASTDDKQSVTALLAPNSIVLRREPQASKWQYVSVDTESVFVAMGDTITEIRPDGSVWQERDGKNREISSAP